MQTLQAYKHGVIPLSWASLLRLTFNFILIKNNLFLCHCTHPTLCKYCNDTPKYFYPFGFLIIMIFIILVGGIFTLLTATFSREWIDCVCASCLLLHAPGSAAHTSSNHAEMTWAPVLPNLKANAFFITKVYFHFKAHRVKTSRLWIQSQCIKHKRNNLVQQLEDTHYLTCNQGFSFCLLPGKERERNATGFQRYDKWDPFSLAFCFKKCIFTVKWGNTSL